MPLIFSNKFYRGKKKSKYNNKKVKLEDGTTFDSKDEYIRWKTLCILQDKGFIQNLDRQVDFDLLPAFKGVQRAMKYVADFTYTENGKLVVEDAKGFKTEGYKIKKKLMYYFHRVIIKET